MNFWNRFLIGAPVLALTIAVGCSMGPGAPSAAPAGSATATSATASQSYTGEQLFRGIAMNHGRVALAIPEIRDGGRLENLLSRRQLKQALRLSDQIVAAIATKQPGYFDTFKADMESGDRLRIRQSLEGAGKLLEETTAKLPEALAMAKSVEKSIQSGKRPNDICVNCDDDGGGGGGDEGGGDEGGDEGGGDEGGDTGGVDSGDDGGGAGGGGAGGGGAGGGGAGGGGVIVQTPGIIVQNTNFVVQALQVQTGTLRIRFLLNAIAVVHPLSLSKDIAARELPIDQLINSIAVNLKH